MCIEKKLELALIETARIAPKPLSLIRELIIPVLPIIISAVF
ncbi:MAG TPA: hypothetical protein PKA79_00095 [Oligoflexia bacterium]|nr:hypothetical protein [Oligoflexia bacterium]